MLRNVLIHAVVALAALHAVAASPAAAAYPGPYVVYPEGEVLVFAPADAGND